MRNQKRLAKVMKQDQSFAGTMQMKQYEDSIIRLYLCSSVVAFL